MATRNERSGFNNNPDFAQSIGLDLKSGISTSVRVNGSIDTPVPPSPTTGAFPVFDGPAQFVETRGGTSGNSTNNADSLGNLAGTSDYIQTINTLTSVGDTHVFEIPQMLIGQAVWVRGHSLSSTIQIETFTPGGIPSVTANVFPNSWTNAGSLAGLPITQFNYDDPIFIRVTALGAATDFVLEVITGALDPTPQNFLPSPDFDFYEADVSRGEVLGFATNLTGAIVQVFDPQGNIVYGQGSNNVNFT